MVGVSKKTGNDYSIYTCQFLLPLTSSDERRSTADWTRIAQGFNVVTFNPSEGLHQKLETLARTKRLPLEVEITLEQQIDRDGKLISYLAEVDAAVPTVQKVG